MEFETLAARCRRFRTTYTFASWLHWPIRLPLFTHFHRACVAINFWNCISFFSPSHTQIASTPTHCAHIFIYTGALVTLSRRKKYVIFFRVNDQKKMIWRTMESLLNSTQSTFEKIIIFHFLLRWFTQIIISRLHGCLLWLLLFSEIQIKSEPSRDRRYTHTHIHKHFTLSPSIPASAAVVIAALALVDARHLLMINCSGLPDMREPFPN